MVHQSRRSSIAGGKAADVPEQRELLATTENGAAAQAAPEPDLVRRAQGGDREAVDALVNQYEKLVLLEARRCVRRIRGTRAWDPALEVADVQQEAWACFLELIRTYNPARGVPFTAYIAVKLRWRLANFVRRQRKAGQERVMLDRLFDEAVEHAASCLLQDARSGDIAAAEARACLAPLLSTLSEHRRLLLQHWYVEGLETSDIAQRFGTTTGAVRMLHRRTLSALRRLISAKRMRKA